MMPYTNVDIFREKGKVLDQHTTYRGTAIPFLARVDCKIKISNANFTSEIRKTIVLGIF
jgi:hypothetical protein